MTGEDLRAAAKVYVCNLRGTSYTEQGTKKPQWEFSLLSWSNVIQSLVTLQAGFG